jgi:AraC-like DNA-binding protein
MAAAGFAQIARNLNVSPRYLQDLLAATGKPFSAHVNELRLARALALLQDRCSATIWMRTARQSG